MGNQSSNKTNKENANVEGQKVFLSLRCRDIILHYSYKMKLTIADISLFPHGLQGLRLWDQDVILSRYIILQNEKFKNKSAFVFKGGVGIVGITLSKWGGCKKIDMCDTRPQVVSNMTKNCQRNQIKNVKCFEVNLAEFGKYAQTYDLAFSTDLFSQGFQPHVILNIWRKVLKMGGESIMLMPDKKDQCRKFLEIVDRTEFKIQNMLLTADQYEASPLLNKQEGESQFPQIGKTNFYLISLTKLREKSIAEIKAEQQELQQNKKAITKVEQKVPVTKTGKKEQTVIKEKQVIVREEIKQQQSLPVNIKEQKKQATQQKPIETPKQEKQRSENKEVKIEKPKQQINKLPQNSEKKQAVEEKKSQETPQEMKRQQRQQQKMTQKTPQQKKTQEIQQQNKKQEIPQERQTQQIQKQSRRQQIQQEEKKEEMPLQKKQQKIQQENKKEEIIQEKKLEEPEEKKTQEIQQDNRRQQIQQKEKTQEVPQENKTQLINQEKKQETTQEKNRQEAPQESKTQQIQQQNKTQEIKQENVLEDAPLIDLFQQNGSNKETNLETKQQIKQQSKQQTKQQQKSQEQRHATAITTDKQEHDKQVQEERPKENAQYNINEQEIVQNGYVPSQDQKNQDQPQKVIQNNQEQLIDITQNPKAKESNKDSKKKKKQHKKHKQTNPETLI